MQQQTTDTAADAHQLTGDRVIADIKASLPDWLDFENTDRKIIARRLAGRPFLPFEAAAMRSAQELLVDGRISIVVKPGFGHMGRRNFTYVAVRVK
jgi:hypothetical protein